MIFTSGESVDTMVRVINLDAFAVSIAYATIGFPFRNLMFLFGTPFESPRAGITAITLFFILRIIAFWPQSRMGCGLKK